MKNKCAIIWIFLFMFLGCRHEPPEENEVKKRMTEYFQSVNLPNEIEEILIFPLTHQPRFYPIEINIRAKIYTSDKQNIFQIVNNTYDSKFNHLTYGYWLASFSLRREPPPDSIIYKVSCENLQINSDEIKIIKVSNLDEKEQFYSVIVLIEKENIKKQFTLPFFQDELGVWKIGKSNLVTPEGAVKEFLSEVNKGNTDKARRYFSYDYKLGYDESDQKNLENLFPPGSIKDISISDIISIKDTADLKLTVVKSDADTFKTNLQMIKCGIEWRFNYNGWDWKFKSTNL